MTLLVRYLEPKKNSDVKDNFLKKTIDSIRSEINESDYHGYKWKGYSSDKNDDNNCLKMGQGEYCTCQWGTTPQLVNGDRVCRGQTNPFDKTHITTTSTGCSDNSEPVAWGKDGTNAQGFSCFQDETDTFCGTGTKFDSGRCISTVDITSDNASMCGTGTKFDSGMCKVDNLHGTFLGRILDNAFGTTK